MLFEEDQSSTARRTLSASSRILRRLHLDGPLLASLAVVISYGLFVLYSATGQNLAQWLNQVERLGLAVGALLLLAQIPPPWLKRLSPAMYMIGIVLLLGVKGRKVFTRAVARLNASDGPVAMTAAALFIQVPLEHFTANGRSVDVELAREDRAVRSSLRNLEVNP